MSMNAIAKKIGITLLTAATALAPVSIAPAYAGEGNNWLRADSLERQNPQYQPSHVYRYNKHRARPHLRGRHRDNTDAIVLGIIGLGVGAVIGGAIANSHNSPRVIYRSAPRTVKSGGRYQPWSKSWFRYCSKKFRSFNASTGTYRGYDGRDHFCVAR
jgi:hypothetical protein